jgi:hypothetical protein
MQKPLLLSLLVLLPCLLFAQRQYLDATITANDGTKIIGKIAVENWLRTPRTLDFQTGEGASKVYQVSDLAGFEVTRHDGAKLVFDRKVVELEASPNNLKELDFEPTLHYQRDTAWLQLIYQGAWKLYTLIDRSGKSHYLVETEGQQPVDLVLKQWRRQNDREQLIQQVELYRKQLGDLVKDCPTAQKKLLSKGWGPKPGEGLQEKDLLNFLKDIDKCNGVQAAYIITPEKSKMTGQVLAGLHLSNYKFRPASYKEIKGVLGFQIGFGVNYFLKKSNKRTAFYNEVIFINDWNKVDSTISKGTQKTISILEYRSSQIGVNNMLSIRISKLPIAPTLKFGLSHRFGINWDITERSGLASQLESAPTYNRSFYKRFYEMGPAVGFSTQFRRIGLDIRLANTYLVGFFGLSKKPNSRYIALNLTYQVF